MNCNGSSFNAIQHLRVVISTRLPRLSLVLILLQTQVFAFYYTHVLPFVHFSLSFLSLEISFQPNLGSAAASRLANLKLNLRQLGVALGNGQGGDGTSGGFKHRSVVVAGGHRQPFDPNP